MKWLPSVLVVAMVLCLSTGASGEYYQYTDKDGTIRYTDDPSMIPEDQGPEVKTFESIQSEPPLEVTGEEDSQAEEEAEVTEDSEETETDAAKIKSPNREKEDELNTLRGELRRTFDSLEAEKSALGPPPPKNAKTSVRKAYNNKVLELNRKIDDYDKRSKEFSEKVKAYNDQIGK